MTRITLNPKHPNNHLYEELCALAAIGELSAYEFDDLRGHLTDCDTCRALYADFRRISTDDLGMIAVARRFGQEDPSSELINEEALLSRFLDRAQHERSLAAAVPACAPPQERLSIPMLDRIYAWWRRPALSYGAAALLMCVVAGLTAYRLKEAQMTPTLANLSSQVKEWKDRTAATETREESTARSLQQMKTERDSLQQSLAETEAKSDDLHAQEKNLESRIAQLQSQVDQKNQDLDAADQTTKDKTKQLAQLQMRLQAALQRTTEQENIAENLRLRLKSVEESAATEMVQAGAIPHPGAASSSSTMDDADVRNLFGARDLHIVDVYDVDSAGKTKRTFGRVYYAEKQLLVFYAFDLEDKRHNRAAAGFQAWGYRQSNESKPEDLGLFYVDDASLNRWVLKVKNPRVLEHVDAVFVTLEPPSGSPSPRGRRLLYANLAGPANHP